MGKVLVLYFVKYPEPGKVKTRLAKTVGNEKAAEIYKQLAEKNYTVLKQSSEVAVTFDPEEKESAIKAWLQDANVYILQEGDGLGERLFHAFCQGFELEYSSVMAIGSDTLGLTAECVKTAINKLKTADSVIGPAKDGGYYLIGLSRKPDPSIFEDIDWSTEQTRNQTISKLKGTGYSCQLLTELEDLDEESQLDLLED